MNRRPNLILLACIVLFVGACVSAPVAQTIITPVIPSPESTSRVYAPSPAPSVVSQPAVPPWWPADLSLPKGSVLTTGGKEPAVWKTADLDVDGLKNDLVDQGKGAGYTVYPIAESEGSIYDVLFAKGANTILLNLTGGTDATILTGERVGTMHLRVAGAANLELNLPLRERLNTSPGSEISLGTSLPNSACNRCTYFINVHIAPFHGPGSYASQPAGTFIIDVELIPGGTAENDDYRWAKTCAVQVKDPNSGSFDCRGLVNINDNTKAVDVSGTWQQPP